MFSLCTSTIKLHAPLLYINIAKSARDLYYQELKTANMKLIANIGETSVIKTSDASLTEEVSSSKAMIMVIAAILEGFISLGVVFVINLLKDDDKDVEATTEG